MESLVTIRLWAAAAWADGHLHRDEAAALRRLIDASDDLGDDQRRIALGYLDAAPPVEPSEVRVLRPEAREGVYRAALGIVRLDKRVTPDEVEWLARLRDALDLDPEIVAGIEREVPSN